MNPWLVGLFVVSAVYVAVSLVFAARQDVLFFQPKRTLAATPTEAGLAYEDVAIVSEPGVELHAWWLPRAAGADGPGAAFTLLYLHGANTNLGDRVDALTFWHGLGFAILALDYRGYGRSTGRPTEAGLHADVAAAWRWLVETRGLVRSELMVAAESLGVSLASELASGAAPAAMVLEAGFTGAADMALRRYPWLPVRQMIRLDLGNADRLGRVRCPKLIVHSVEDALVPITMGRRLHQRAAPPCEILTIRGAHARACREGGERYRRGLERWLAGLPRP
ncbi:MAG: alpha/beta hydrolase [Candidatus Krumholzibacteriia bacterium]